MLCLPGRSDPHRRSGVAEVATLAPRIYSDGFRRPINSQNLVDVEHAIYAAAGGQRAPSSPGDEPYSWDSVIRMALRGPDTEALRILIESKKFNFNEPLHIQVPAVMDSEFQPFTPILNLDMCRIRYEPDNLDADLKLRETKVSRVGAGNKTVLPLLIFTPLEFCILMDRPLHFELLIQTRQVDLKQALRNDPKLEFHFGANMYNIFRNQFYDNAISLLVTVRGYIRLPARFSSWLDTLIGLGCDMNTCAEIDRFCYEISDLVQFIPFGLTPNTSAATSGWVYPKSHSRLFLCSCFNSLNADLFLADLVAFKKLIEMGWLPQSDDHDLIRLASRYSQIYHETGSEIPLDRFESDVNKLKKRSEMTSLKDFVSVKNYKGEVCRLTFELLCRHINSPASLSLQLLARNEIRRSIGGVHFKARASRLIGTPPKIIDFIIDC